MLNLYIKKIPDTPAEKWEWIKYQLRTKDSNLSDIAHHFQVTRGRISHVKYIPATKVEKRIAKIIGFPVEEIWPERYPNYKAKALEVATNAE